MNFVVVDQIAICFNHPAEIPWGLVFCDANESMIKLFFREREVDNFGVYIGDYGSGDIYSLPKRV